MVVRAFGSSVKGVGQAEPASEPAPKFVGSQVCGKCHQTEFKLWAGSHHQLAMQPAAAATVLGDFNHVKFVKGKVVTFFYRNGSKFMVRTGGPDGALHDYRIKFTFGVFPLQQYLIAMPGGRLQALGIAWDSRPRRRGGQRWFSLYPGQKIAPHSPLYWTGVDQNWNYMCADCHSTNLRKNYDPKSRTYATTYAEIDVGCEECHGPGSNHVAWAKRRGKWRRRDRSEGLTITFDELKGVTWAINPATNQPQRSRPRTSEREIQVCARCHSRRGKIHEDYVHGQPVGEDYRVALLDPELYFPDGQIKGEVYEYGSFIQSRMFHEGVTCSDCHDPHSLKLRAPGNNVCLRCHLAAKYNSPKHHFHPKGSAGSRCVSCHMPTRTYMIVDARRDHSIRIPRPDLSVALGVPNACNQCHKDKSARWAANWLKRWYGHEPVGFQRFAKALSMGRRGAPGAQAALRALVSDRSQPAIARATALSMLAGYGFKPGDPILRAAVTDRSPLIRRAAAGALTGTDAAGVAAMLAPLLRDRVRAVRIEAAYTLTGLPTTSLPSGSADALRGARAQYIAAQELNADRPEAHLDLASLFVKEGIFDRAEAELKTALSIGPSFAPAAVNLADLYRQLGQEKKCEAVLTAALRRSPDSGSLNFALALAMVREKKTSEAVALLARAARLDPAQARYAYAYAIALNDTGRTAAAMAALTHALKLHPYDRDLLQAAAAIAAQSGDTAAARAYASRLDQIKAANAPSNQQSPRPQ